MPILQDVSTIKYLLSLVAILSGCNIAIIGFFLKRYMNKVDKNEKRLDTLETEHKIFHKNETGING